MLGSGNFTHYPECDLLCVKRELMDREAKNRWDLVTNPKRRKELFRKMGGYLKQGRALAWAASRGAFGWLDDDIYAAATAVGAYGGPLQMGITGMAQVEGSTKKYQRNRSRNRMYRRGRNARRRRRLKRTGTRRSYRKKRASAQCCRTLARRIRNLEKARETKFKDIFNQVVSIEEDVRTTGGTYISTGGWARFDFYYPGQGDSVIAREGRKLDLQSLYIRGNFARIAGDSTANYAFRVLIVQDMRNNQLQTSPTEILATTHDFNAIYDIAEAEHRGRFNILDDFTFMLPSATTNGGSAPVQFKRFYTKKQLKPIVFEATNTGMTSAAVESGHISMFICGTNDTQLTAWPTTGSYPRMHFNARMRWLSGE